MPADNCCYLCNECPKTFATLCELQWHLGENHVRDKPRNEKCKIEMSDDKKCKTENKEEEMLNYEEDNAMEILASSSDFSSTDEPLSSPPIHQNNINNTSSIAASGSYHCLKCTRIFSCRDQLNIHYTHTHRDKPQYVCEICEKVFGVKRELSTHSRIHEGIEPHKCAQCGKEFGTRQLLKKHNMWHTGERSHVCETCGKAFFQKGHLTQHLMIHKGGRPHQCRLCEKTFIFKFDLNRHMKIHAERGHACPQCGKCFPKKSNLDEHTLKCINNKNSSLSENSKNSSCSPLRRSPLMSSFSPPPAKRPALASLKVIPSVSENSITTNENKSSLLNTFASNQSQANIINQNASKFPFSSNEPDIYKMAKLLMTQQFNQQQNQKQQPFAAQNLNNFFKQQNNNNNSNSSFSTLNSMTHLNPALFPMSLKPATITSNSNVFYCFICNKNLYSQAAYMLHWSIVHLKIQTNISPVNNNTSINNLTDYQFKNQEQQLFLQKFPLMKIEELSSESSATSSSCASSPQKVSPMAMSFSNNQTLVKPNNSSLIHHSPCESTTSDDPSLTNISIEVNKNLKNDDISAAHCSSCDASRDRENILTRQLTLAQSEVERLKQLVQQVFGSILGVVQQQNPNPGDSAAALIGTQQTLPELEKSWMLRAK